MDDKKYLYEEMPVSRALIRFSVPTVLSQLITVAYNVADTFFIGQLNDPSQVAAATLCMPPFILLTGIANLFGIGGASLISRSLGDGKLKKAKQAASFCIWSAAIVSMLYGLMFLILKPFILPILGAKATTYDYCYSYLFWTVTIGALPTVMNSCLSHLIRAEGLSRQAGFGVAFGGVLNIILDPLFIFVLRMNILGAAIATALSNVVAMVYFVIIIQKRKNQTVISANPRYFTAGHGILKEVLIIGLPNFIMNLLGITSNTILNNLMSSYSDAAIAGMGIAKRIDMLTFAVATGMSQGVISLIGYNYAAKKYKRMFKVIKTQFIYSMILAVSTTAFLFLCAVPISSCFIADEATIAYGQQFMKILCIICPMQSVSLMVIAIFQSIGKKTQPLILSFMRKGTIDAPIMLLMNHISGLSGIPWATPIAEVIACIVSIILFLPTLRKLKSFL